MKIGFEAPVQTGEIERMDSYEGSIYLSADKKDPKEVDVEVKVEAEGKVKDKYELIEGSGKVKTEVKVHVGGCQLRREPKEPTLWQRINRHE